MRHGQLVVAIFCSAALRRRHVPLPALNGADVGSVKFRPIAEFFLRQTGFKPDSPYVVPEDRFRIVFHASAVISYLSIRLE